MLRAFKLVVLLLAAASLSEAQVAGHAGTKELGLFTGGGPAIVGGLRDRGFWLAGARWGYQLTGEHGASWVRGHLQYAAEFIPLYLQLQSKTVYGAGLTPLLLRYHFTGGHVAVPFVEMGGGILVTRDQVPEGTSRFNFTPQAGVGLQFAPGGRVGLAIGLRYHHTSNAGIATRNPGINAILVHAGVSWWR